MIRRIIKPRFAKKVEHVTDLKPRDRQAKIFLEKGRENRQRLLEKLRGFSLSETVENTKKSCSPITDINYTLIPHKSLSTPKKRKLSSVDFAPEKSANIYQRLCYFKFVGTLKQSDVEPQKYAVVAKSDSICSKMNKAEENQTLKREYQLAKLRGLDFPGYLNTRRNLGNYLHLTASFNPSFDKCKEQTLPVTVFKTEEYNTYLITGPSPPALSDVFSKAKKLTKCTFTKLGLSTNLYHTKNDQFTTMAISNKNQDIVAVAEYVFMRDYVWIESLCVASEFQGQGIGHMMFNMLYHIGHLVKKELLLYSLHSAVPFYKSCGFSETEQFPFTCDNGMYLSQKTF